MRDPMRKMGDWQREKAFQWSTDDKAKYQMLSSIKQQLYITKNSRYNFGSGRYWKFIAAAAAIIMILGIGLFVWMDKNSSLFSPPPGLHQWVWNTSSDEGVIDFPDGSILSFYKGAIGKVAQTEKHEFNFQLESGMVLVYIKHHPEELWKVQAGPFEIIVTGTRFEITWEPIDKILTLKMQKGQVLLSGPMLEEGKYISAGQQVVINPTAAHLEISGIPTQRSNTPSDIAVSTVAKSSVKAPESVNKDTEKSPSPSPFKSPYIGRRHKDWRALNKQGDFLQVLKDAHRIGLSGLLKSDSSEQLLALGDAARFQKEFKISSDAYQSVRKRFAGSKNSSLASLLLGKMAFYQQKQYKEAAVFLQEYLKEQPHGVLAREALGMLMSSYKYLGAVSEARWYAGKYLDQYPEGPHAESARQLLEGD